MKGYTELLRTKVTALESIIVCVCVFCALKHFQMAPVLRPCSELLVLLLFTSHMLFFKAIPLSDYEN